MQEASGDSLGRSPLQLAVQQMKRELFEHLLMIGARTDLQDINVSRSILKKEYKDIKNKKELIDF